MLERSHLKTPWSFFLELFFDSHDLWTFFLVYPRLEFNLLDLLLNSPTKDTWLDLKSFAVFNFAVRHETPVITKFLSLLFADS